jgi:hypothetical protein
MYLDDEGPEHEWEDAKGWVFKDSLTGVVYRDDLMIASGISVYDKQYKRVKGKVWPTEAEATTALVEFLRKKNIAAARSIEKRSRIIGRLAGA